MSTFTDEEIRKVASIVESVMEAAQDFRDYEAADIVDLLIETGVAEEGTVAEDDMEWAQDFDLEIGDRCWKVSDFGMRIRKTASRPSNR